MTPMVGDTVLRVEAMSFSYRDRHVFSSWSMEFEGGLTWLQGANGSGKSTLLKLLGGALTPKAGRLIAAGTDSLERPIDYRRGVFWCGPGPIAFDHLLAAEYFGFLRGLYPQFDSSALSAHVEGFGLCAHMNTPIRAMSTGTQRKVWLAAALVAGTAVVLLDEPLNALDSGSLEYARQALARHALGSPRAWIVASHGPPCELDQRAKIVALP